MRLITGDETGLIKTTALEAQRIVVAGSQSRSRAIRALCWARGHAAYAAARQDGVVTVWEDGEKVGYDTMGLGLFGWDGMRWEETAAAFVDRLIDLTD